MDTNSEATVLRLVADVMDTVLAFNNNSANEKAECYINKVPVIWCGELYGYVYDEGGFCIWSPSTVDQQDEWRGRK